MKTVLRITPDHDTDIVYSQRVDDINYLVNELDVYCEIRNNHYINIVEEEKRYSSDEENYTDSIRINATGYSQSEWQEYKLYFNSEDIKSQQEKIYFDQLVQYLERTFTHLNQYFCELYHKTEINGEEFTSSPFECYSLTLTETELKIS